ncbi:putative bacteriocin export ABC transporter [Enterococcus faecalis 13-SD-W-01]|nr:putative bacteriocin export ABC transporter [Enterococcus faecalis 13-SD-W-01]
MIEAKNIKKVYKEKTVFENLSFFIEAGEMVAITGESGKGKTTLLNCLGQLEKIDAGEITFNGKVLKPKNLREFFKNEAGYLFQNFALVDNETVKENLKLVSKNTEEILASLKKFQVDDLIDKKIYQLSGGEQQRVALARLILKKPSIIFADEPTASLDNKNRDIVFSALEEMNKEGTTIIVVTHDTELASRFPRQVDLSVLGDVS